MSYSRYVNPEDFRLMLEKVKIENVFADRDTALLVAFYSTGMTLSEVSRLKVRDVFDAKGELRSCFDLTPQDSFNGNVRRIYWIASWFDEIAKAYLAWRKKTFADQFGADGFLPADEPFFVDDEGVGYKEKNAREVNQKIYKTSTALSLKIRELHRKGNIPDGNAESARRSFSVWLVMGFLTGSPVHIDWIRVVRGDQRLSTTVSAIHKDIPEDFDALAAVFSSAHPFNFR